MTSAVAILSLILAGLAAALAARPIVAEEGRAAGTAAFFVLFGALLVVPIQLSATLQLLGVLPRISLLPPALVSGLVVGWLLSRPPAQRLPVPLLAPEQTPLSTWSRVAAAIVGAAYLVFAVERASGFPSSWDGVAYHLPLAVKWLQEGSLAIGATADWRESGPGNAEIVALLTLGTGWHGLAELWNVASALGLAAGAHLLAQGMGAGRSAAFATALVVLGLPVVLYQTFSAYVDVFGAAAVIAALGLVVRAASPPARHPGTGLLLLAGLGCGLAAGTKPTLWVPAALVACAGLGGLLRSRPDQRLRWGFLFAAVVAAPCLFWFARSFAASGNPFYPVAVEIAGWKLNGYRPSELTGPRYDFELVRSRAEWLVYPWIEYKRSGYGWSTGSGLGPLFAAFVPPGVLYTLLTLRGRPRGSARAVPILCVVALLVVAATWWLVGQGPQLRFGLPMIVVCCALAAPLFDALERARPRATGGLLVAAATGFALLAGLEPATQLMRRVRDQSWARFRQYGVPELIDRLPPCAVVVNANAPREFWSNFALAGRRLSNTVVPPWEVHRVLNRRPAGSCPIYVFDREPFLPPDAADRLASFGYQPVPVPSDPAWRVWRWFDR
jgi:hypothetical protein